MSLDSDALELTDNIASLMDGKELDIVVPALAWLFAESVAALTEFKPDKKAMLSAAAMFSGMYADLCNINQTAPNGVTLN